MAAWLMLASTVQAGTIDRMRQDGTIRIAYRLDAPPFSFQGQEAKPAGLIVDLCQSVVQRLSQQIDLPDLKIAYVPIPAADRFDAIQQGKADLLCEATSVTLARRKMLDFSIATFVDGAGLLTTSQGPRSLREIAGQGVGVLGGTTTE